MLKRVQSFFIKNSVWMHLTALLWVAFLYMKLSQQGAAKMYIGWVGGLVIFSIPTFLFVINRDSRPRGRKIGYWLIWTLIFVLYPVLLYVTKVEFDSLEFITRFLNNDLSQESIYSLAGLYLLVELIIYVNSADRFNNSNKSWVSNLSVFKLSLIIASIFCIFLLSSNNYFSDYIRGFSWAFAALITISCFILLFVVYFSYYIYYYIHHYILYNSLLKNRGLLPYFFGLVLTILVVVPIHNFLISLVPLVSDLKLHTIGLMPQVYDDLNFGLPILVLLLSFPLIVIIEWYKQSNALTELEKQQSKTELSLLRQQINPHFFFNTLNNLYSMSLTNEKETPETILQLSELMRYVIYKGKEERVKIVDEIKYIKDYINLQMIRVHHAVDLKLNFEIQDDQVEIPPLLFIILIENAFKHGIEPAGSASLLHISMKTNTNSLIFECTNSKNQISSEHTSGIGLANLRKRLDILYPNDHKLQLKEGEETFTATLNIEL